MKKATLTTPWLVLMVLTLCSALVGLIIGLVLIVCGGWLESHTANNTQATSSPTHRNNVANAGHLLQVRENAGDLPITDLTWMGRIFANDLTETTLTGSAQSIYEQVISINPNYVHERPVHLPSDSLKNSTNVMNCTIGEPTGYHNCDEGIQFLYDIGGSCVVDPNSCTNLYCATACRMQLCSTTYKRVIIDCVDAADIYNSIRDQCQDTELSVHGTLGPAAAGRDYFEAFYEQIDLFLC